MWSVVFLEKTHCWIPFIEWDVQLLLKVLLAVFMWLLKDFRNMKELFCIYKSLGSSLFFRYIRHAVSRAKKIKNFHMRISMNFLFWGLTDVLTNFHFAHHTLYVYQCRCQVKRYTRARSELCTVSFTKQVIIAFITNLFIISSLLTQKMWADKRAAKIFNDLLSHSFLPFCWSCNNCLLGVPDKQFGSYFDELVCLPLSILQNSLKNELVLQPICFYHIHSKISSLWQWLLD